MEWIVNAREMKTCDNATTEHFKMSADVLMERAALSVVAEIKKQEKYRLDKILVLCGAGNNGADGVAVARLLHLQGYDTEIYLAAKGNTSSSEQKKQLEIAKQYQVKQTEQCDVKSCTLIIDAIFGIGLSRAVESDIYDLIKQVNESHVPVVSIDIASGISADTANVMGIAIKADRTVTFAFKKLGQLLFPGAEYTGTLVLCDVGIPEEGFLEKNPACCALKKEDLCLLPERTARSHKGSYGKVLVVAGKCDMAGAAFFAAKAAYVSGCGLVRVFTAEENRSIVQQLLPEAILTTYSAKKLEKASLTEAVKWADVVAIGPGIGTDSIAADMVDTVLRVASVPVVLDADALNIIAMDTNILLRPHTELVVTPHPGELASLTGVSVSYITGNLIAQAEEFAREYNVICVLKDARTICSVPYGRTYVNTSGNHGMATAGSGDVLCGLITGLIAQGLQPDMAAPLGVYIHGLCGDEMVKETGYHGLLASDLLDGIKKVMK